MITTEIALDTSDVRTCPQSTDERAIGIEWNLSKIPLCRSSNMAPGAPSQLALASNDETAPVEDLLGGELEVELEHGGL
jgi:hypothetical protein